MGPLPRTLKSILEIALSFLPVPFAGPAFSIRMAQAIAFLPLPLKAARGAAGKLP
jgi:hypothetical protein